MALGTGATWRTRSRALFARVALRASQHRSWLLAWRPSWFPVFCGWRGFWLRSQRSLVAAMPCLRCRIACRSGHGGGFVVRARLPARAKTSRLSNSPSRTRRSITFMLILHALLDNGVRLLCGVGPRSKEARIVPSTKQCVKSTRRPRPESSVCNGTGVLRDGRYSS